MSESKKTKAVATSQREKKKYPASKLLKSETFSGYQQDFAKVILGNQEYTVPDAKDKLDKMLKKQEVKKAEGEEKEGGNADA
ncbi:MAG TPA: hypothetical protein IAA51_02610 [Candidatus Cottocaccamicrobium excrementipullorum]|nr:hypothetical protein [Candidatus Cottocaccamicrobium excrementipullorum]